MIPVNWTDLSAEQMIVRRAPPGKVWRCKICGQTAEDRRGEIGYSTLGFMCVEDNSLELADAPDKNKPAHPNNSTSI